MKAGIATKINQFFANEMLEDVTAVVLRMDGVVLYSNIPNASHIGALVAGSWQALKQLSSVVMSGEESGFRLSFDTSSEGIYVLPFEVEGEEYYFAVLYRDIINPAYLKNKMRALLVKFCKFLLETKHSAQGAEVNIVKHCVVQEKKVQSGGKKSLRDDRKSYLFNEITDDEMNQLFSTVGC